MPISFWSITALWHGWDQQGREAHGVAGNVCSRVQVLPLQLRCHHTLACILNMGLVEMPACFYICA